MKNYIFGYGSLINLESAAKTLGRAVKDHDVKIVKAVRYIRLWRLVVSVIVKNKQINAVFLDIQKEPKSEVNGILIEVTLEELLRLDLREIQYNRVDLTNYIRPRVEGGIVYAYQGKPEYFAGEFSNNRVLKQYLNIISVGLKNWGKIFEKKFFDSTKQHNFEVIDGFYKFRDEKQNILTGRK